MIRVLIFLLIAFSSTSGQAQQVNRSTKSMFLHGYSNASSSSVIGLDYGLGSGVLLADYSKRQPIPRRNQDFAIQFFGTPDATKELFENQRWNEVAVYSILFFSMILNVYLILKIARNPQNFTIT